MRVRGFARGLSTVLGAALVFLGAAVLLGAPVYDANNARNTVAWAACVASPYLAISCKSS